MAICKLTNLNITGDERTYKTLSNAKRAIGDDTKISYSTDNGVSPIAFHLATRLTYNGVFNDFDTIEKRNVMGLIIFENDRYTVRYVNSRW